jgi:hypothetical protein
MAIIKIRNPAIDLDAAEIPNLDASKITSGSIADARIPASAVSQHATSFDDNKIVNDISTLAIRQATNENAIAYNTNSSFVDVFQDSSGIASHTTSARNASEYVSSIQSVQTTSTITLNSSNYTTFFDTTADNMMSVRKFTSGQITNDYVFNTSIENNVAFDSVSTFRPGQTVAQSDEATLLGYIFGSGNSTEYILENNDNSATYFLVHVNMKFKANTTFRPNGGSLQARAANGTGNWAEFNFGGLNGTTPLELGVQANPNGNFSFAINQANYYDGIYFRAYHSAANDFKLDSLQIPGTMIYPVETVNATGNFIGNTITAPSSTSKMGAIITYQDQAGTNALNTDIILQLSADNGSTYSTATLTAMPNFASGIKMAKVNDLAVTAGTQLKYKISFANQASGSKEARIRGVSLQY